MNSIYVLIPLFPCVRETFVFQSRVVAKVDEQANIKAGCVKVVEQLRPVFVRQD
jgi:hypothetical protein